MKFDADFSKIDIGISGVIRPYEVTGKLYPAPRANAVKWAMLKVCITAESPVFLLPAGSRR